MKILAIERELKTVDPSLHNLLRDEAAHVWELQKHGVIREIYFNEEHCAVLILEVANLDEAQHLLSSFPLVVKGLIAFDCMELHTYTGLERLFSARN